MIDNRNLILAVVLSLSILIAFEVLFQGPQRQQLLEQQQAQQAQQGVTGTDPNVVPQADVSDIPSAPGAAPTAGAEPGAGMSREDALAAGPRVAIETEALRGSISLVGGRLDDLTLKRYRKTVDPESANIDLLSPLGTARPYFAGFGWSSGDRELDLPDGKTLWRADRDTLTVDKPVTLKWTNEQGVRFEKVIEIDRDYMFTVTQRVINQSEAPVSLSPYGLVSRTGHPDILGFYILHEGLIGVFDGILEELDYDDVEEERVIQQETTGGWIGITDKYWQVVAIPDQQERVNTRFVYSGQGEPGKYQTDFLYEGSAVPPGGTLEKTSRLFAGAKVVERLDNYRDTLPVDRFDLSVDFGWFYFLTKPFFYMLSYFGQLTGNLGVAILIVTVIIKIVFFPLANKSYRSMAKMRKLHPELVKLRERFGEDKQRLNQEMMALYKREGANPLSGCLPILVQIPVFFALYKVLFVSIEMRHAPFFGWIQDLSAPDPTTILNLFGLLPWGAPELGLLNILNIGVWPILMGISMYCQQMLNPQPPDPMQARIFQLMPILFTFLLAQFAAGLVIYWTWNNLLSILQQYVIMRRAGVPIGNAPAPVNTGGGGSSSAPPRGKKKNKRREEDDEDGDGSQHPTSGRKKERRKNDEDDGGDADGDVGDVG